ncbi:reverse transcriptase domain-containing protein [Tanacetum coccineum]
MYLSATHGAISAVLLTDRDSVQTPVYFVSKALKETEINYSAMEKLIMALVFAAKRLRRNGNSLTHLRFEFTVHEQRAEYEALIADLRMQLRMGYEPRSKLGLPVVANHVMVENVAKETTDSYSKTKSLIQGFDRFTIRQNKSISEMEILTEIEEQDHRDDPLSSEFISKGTLPHAKRCSGELRAARRRDSKLRNGVLYRRRIPTYHGSDSSDLCPATNVLREIQAGFLPGLRGNVLTTQATRMTHESWTKVEGPNEVTEALGKEAYKLRDHDGRKKSFGPHWNYLQSSIECVS